jgi:trimeric autotransporter adhesin
MPAPQPPSAPLPTVSGIRIVAVSSTQITVAWGQLGGRGSLPSSSSSSSTPASWARLPLALQQRLQRRKDQLDAVRRGGGASAALLSGGRSSSLPPSSSSPSPSVPGSTDRWQVQYAPRYLARWLEWDAHLRVPVAVISGLEPSCRYTLRVRAHSRVAGAGWGPWTTLGAEGTADVTTLPPSDGTLVAPPPTTAPASAAAKGPRGGASYPHAASALQAVANSLFDDAAESAVEERDDGTRDGGKADDEDDAGREGGTAAHEASISPAAATKEAGMAVLLALLAGGAPCPVLPLGALFREGDYYDGGIGASASSSSSSSAPAAAATPYRLLLAGASTSLSTSRSTPPTTSSSLGRSGAGAAAVLSPSTSSSLHRSALETASRRSSAAGERRDTSISSAGNLDADADDERASSDAGDEQRNAAETATEGEEGGEGGDAVVVTLSSSGGAPASASSSAATASSEAAPAYGRAAGRLVTISRYGRVGGAAASAGKRSSPAQASPAEAPSAAWDECQRCTRPLVEQQAHPSHAASSEPSSVGHVHVCAACARLLCSRCRCHTIYDGATVDQPEVRVWRVCLDCALAGAHEAAAAAASASAGGAEAAPGGLVVLPHPDADPRVSGRGAAGIQVLAPGPSACLIAALARDALAGPLEMAALRWAVPSPWAPGRLLRALEEEAPAVVAELASRWSGPSEEQEDDGGSLERTRARRSSSASSAALSLVTEATPHRPALGRGGGGAGAGGGDSPALSAVTGGTERRVARGTLDGADEVVPPLSLESSGSFPVGGRIEEQADLGLEEERGASDTTGTRAVPRRGPPRASPSAPPLATEESQGPDGTLSLTSAATPRAGNAARPITSAPSFFAATSGASPGRLLFSPRSPQAPLILSPAQLAKVAGARSVLVHASNAKAGSSAVVSAPVALRARVYSDGRVRLPSEHPAATLRHLLRHAGSILEYITLLHAHKYAVSGLRLTKVISKAHAQRARERRATAAAAAAKTAADKPPAAAAAAAAAAADILHPCVRTLLVTKSHVALTSLCKQARLDLTREPGVLISAPLLRDGVGGGEGEGTADQPGVEPALGEAPWAAVLKLRGKAPTMTVLQAAVGGMAVPMVGSGGGGGAAAHALAAPGSLPPASSLLSATPGASHHAHAPGGPAGAATASASAANAPPPPGALHSRYLALGTADAYASFEWTLQRHVRACVRWMCRGARRLSEAEAAEGLARLPALRSLPRPAVEEAARAFVAAYAREEDALVGALATALLVCCSRTHSGGDAHAIAHEVFGGPGPMSSPSFAASGMPPPRQLILLRHAQPARWPGLGIARDIIASAPPLHILFPGLTDGEEEEVEEVEGEDDGASSDAEVQDDSAGRTDRLERTGPHAPSLPLRVRTCDIYQVASYADLEGATWALLATTMVHDLALRHPSHAPGPLRTRADALAALADFGGRVAADPECLRGLLSSADGGGLKDAVPAPALAALASAALLPRLPVLDDVERALSIAPVGREPGEVRVYFHGVTGLGAVAPGEADDEEDAESVSAAMTGGGGGGGGGASQAKSAVPPTPLLERLGLMQPRAPTALALAVKRALLKRGLRVDAARMSVSLSLVTASSSSSSSSSAAADAATGDADGDEKGGGGASSASRQRRVSLAAATEEALRDALGLGLGSASDGSSDAGPESASGGGDGASGPADRLPHEHPGSSAPLLDVASLAYLRRYGAPSASRRTPGGLPPRSPGRPSSSAQSAAAVSTSLEGIAASGAPPPAAVSTSGSIFASASRPVRRGPVAFAVVRSGTTEVETVERPVVTREEAAAAAAATAAAAAAAAVAAGKPRPKRPAAESSSSSPRGAGMCVPSMREGVVLSWDGTTAVTLSLWARQQQQQAAAGPAQAGSAATTAAGAPPAEPTCLGSAAISLMGLFPGLPERVSVPLLTRVRVRVPVVHTDDAPCVCSAPKKADPSSAPHADGASENEWGTDAGAESDGGGGEGGRNAASSSSSVPRGRAGRRASVEVEGEGITDGVETELGDSPTTGLGGGAEDRANRTRFAAAGQLALVSPSRHRQPPPAPAAKTGGDGGGEPGGDGKGGGDGVGGGAGAGAGAGEDPHVVEACVEVETGRLALELFYWPLPTVVFAGKHGGAAKPSTRRRKGAAGEGAEAKQGGE